MRPPKPPEEKHMMWEIEEYFRKRRETETPPAPPEESLKPDDYDADDNDEAPKGAHGTVDGVVSTAESDRGGNQ